MTNSVFGSSASPLVSFRFVRMLILAVAVQAGTTFAATASEPTQAVMSYIDDTTAIVAWTDLEKLKLDETLAFLKKWGTRLGDLSMAHKVRDALTQLGVTRIYWISDLAGVMSGPQAAIVPCNPDSVTAVQLVLDAVAGDQGTVEVDGNTVLVGKAEAVADLKKRNGGETSAELLQTLSATEGDHGVILLTPATIITPIRGLLPLVSKVENTEFVDRLAGLLGDLKSLSFAGDLPPVNNSLSVTMKSSKAAAALARLLDEWTTAELADASAPLRATATDAKVTWTTSSEKEVDAVMHSFMQLAAPARKRAKLLSIQNSLKQIALAFHIFYDKYGHFPPQALTDKKGKRLLSWRVMILPFLDHEELYKEFHLDEPWDSDHNKKLIKRMPFPYRSGNQHGEVNVTTTRMLAPLTKNSAMGRPGPGVDFREIIDGTSNSLLIVEAGPGREVVWTKPDDLEINLEDPLRSIVDESSEGFAACTCDGAARFFSNKIELPQLKAILSINGKEIVDWEKLK